MMFVSEKGLDQALLMAWWLASVPSFMPFLLCLIIYIPLLCVTRRLSPYDQAHASRVSISSIDLTPKVSDVEVTLL